MHLASRMREQKKYDADAGRLEITYCNYEQNRDGYICR